VETMMKIWIGVFLALSAVNSYGAVNYSNNANKGYSQSRVNRPGIVGDSTF